MISNYCYGTTTNALDWSAIPDQEEPLNALLAGQMRRIQKPAFTSYEQMLQALSNPAPTKQQTTTPIMDKPKRRIVQVFIADPDPDVPLENALLYKGETKFTDATDQELYFELQIADILKKHNDQRVKWLDKDATKKTGKDMFLDPIKVRDLRMAVVTIAEF